MWTKANFVKVEWRQEVVIKKPSYLECVLVFDS